MTVHGLVLPVWLCGTCDRPWPRANRRAELLGECATSPAALTDHLGSRLTAGWQDMSGVLAETVYRRFLGWLS